MVSTRRMAHQEPQGDAQGDKDINNTIRKKPVRRTTAKAVIAEDRPKTTRSRNNARTAEPLRTMEEVEPVLNQIKPASRQAKQPAGRSEQQTTDKATSVTTSAQAGRVTRARKTQTVANGALKQEQSKSEPGRARQTRNITAKATPLSPKKVGQVSRPQTRNARSANLKAPLGRKNVVLPPPSNRAATRRRKVSDENADFLELAPVMVEDVGGEETLSSSAPIELAASLKIRPIELMVEEAETLMVSRPTTPPESPRPDFDSLQDEGEYRRRGAVSPTSVGDDDGDHTEASEDELCGPKTPMKRSSPGAGARYRASAQKAIRQANDELPIRTPVTDAGPFRNQGRTPRTQLSYFRPTIPGSTDRPMTVTRGGDRSFVIKDLGSSLVGQAETASIAHVYGDVVVEQAPEGDHGHASSVASDNWTEAVHEEQSNECTPPSPSLQQSADVQLADDIAEPELPDSVVDVSQMEAEEDPNATILVADIADESRPVSPIPKAYEWLEPGDNVLVTRDDEDAELYGDVGAEYEHEAAPSSTSFPETLIWDNIRQDPTIKVDFDAHLGGAWTLPQGEPTERLEIAAGVGLLNDVGEILFLAEETETTNRVMEGPVIAAMPLPEVATDTTLNLNDFIDVTALAVDREEESWESKAPIEKNTSEDLILDEGSQKGDARPMQREQRGGMITVPHYALPTAAYDARRKSMPAVFHTPIKVSARPHTSDGASIGRMSKPFSEQWLARSRAKSANATPIRSRQCTSHGAWDDKRLRTPGQPSNECLATPSERSPKLGARPPHQEHAKTIAVSTRFLTPAHAVPRRPFTAQKPEANAAAPPKSTLRPRRQSGAFSSVEEAIAVSPTDTTSGPPTPTPAETQGERFPRLKPRPNYEEHAKTVAAPKRFRTPTQTPMKRPSTVFKPSSLRKVALANYTPPLASHTPVKTPLKPPAMTPSQAPMTPHPAAPLKGVMALVEVFTLEGASASAPFLALLHRLGARTTKAWSERVTHVVFKDGSPTTLQRVRLNNKDAEKSGTGAYVHCVNSRWVTDCDTEGTRMDESDEAYAVDLTEVPRGGKRRHKSMEPAALSNVNGNVVQNRRSSLGRSSLGRSPLKYDSPAKRSEITVEITPRSNKEEEKEDSTDDDDPSSPVTPAYLAAPDTLVQQTAPINRMRKLGLKAKDRANNRRLTFWHGGA